MQYLTHESFVIQKDMRNLSLVPFDLVGFIGPFPNHDPLNSDRMRDFDSETPFVFDSLIPFYRKKTR